jgi:hypothetical protein
VSSAFRLKTLGKTCLHTWMLNPRYRVGEFGRMPYQSRRLRNDLSGSKG